MDTITLSDGTRTTTAKVEVRLQWFDKLTTSGSTLLTTGGSTLLTTGGSTLLTTSWEEE